MTKTLEDKMNELPEDRREAVKKRADQLYIEMVGETQNEDGSVTYSFDMTESMSQTCGELGLKLLLYCGICGVSPEQAYDTIFKVHASKEDQENKWKACSSCGGPSQDDFCSLCVEEE